MRPVKRDLRLGVALLGLSVGAVVGDVPGTHVAPWLKAPKSWEANLAPPNEPGGQFVMEGRLLGPGGKTPMRGVKLFVYHADRDGLYARKGEQYMRLVGVLRTDARGRYRVRSALPGQYGGPPHVHFEAWGPDLPLHLWFVNLYRDPKERPDSSWGRMGVSHGQLRIHPPEAIVTRDALGVFHAHCDLYWDRGFVASAHDDSTRRGIVAP